MSIIDNQAKPKNIYNNESLSQFAVNNNQSMMNTIKNEISEQKGTDKAIKEVSKSLKTSIFIVGTISLLAALVIILIVLLTKKDNNSRIKIKTPETNIDTTYFVDSILNSSKDISESIVKITSEISTMDITISTSITTSMSTLTEEKNLTSIVKDDNNDDISNFISYEEAQTLIGLKEIKESHDLLNDTSFNLEQFILFCNNTNFSKLNITINDLPENIESLINNTNNISLSFLEIVKTGLNIYHSKYKSLIQEVNTINDEITTVFDKFIYPQLDILKGNIDNIRVHLENTIQTLAIHFKLNLTDYMGNLRYLDVKEDIGNIIRNIYKETKDKIYDSIEKLLGKYDSSLTILTQMMDYIYIKINSGILDLKLISEGLAKIFVDEYFVNNLKNKLFSFTEEFSFKIEIFDSIIQELKIFVNELKTNIDSFIKENHEILDAINKEL